MQGKMKKVYNFLCLCYTDTEASPKGRLGEGSVSMKADCHMHMVLDGVDWKQAIARHSVRPDENFIRNTLAHYRDLGYTYLRDGGDKWGVGAKARELAPEYGITYRTQIGRAHV